MGSSWSRNDRIIRLAKLRGDKAALAIMGNDLVKKDPQTWCPSCRAGTCGAHVALVTESELRALWGDR